MHSPPMHLWSKSSQVNKSDMYIIKDGGVRIKQYCGNKTNESTAHGRQACKLLLYLCQNVVNKWYC